MILSLLIGAAIAASPVPSPVVSPVQQKPVTPRYDYLPDEDGKIIATFDRKDNSVSYGWFEAKKVIMTMDKYLQNANANSRACQAKLQQLGGLK